jgi:hypothetical protein
MLPLHINTDSLLCPHVFTCKFACMKPPRRPPVNPEVIREARLRKGMTQEQVQDECHRLGRRVYNLSRMESGELKWPSPQALPVLAEALGLKVDDLFTAQAVAA